LVWLPVSSNYSCLWQDALLIISGSISTILSIDPRLVKGITLTSSSLITITALGLIFPPAPEPLPDPPVLSANTVTGLNWQSKTASTITHVYPVNNPESR
jgi:hypothetical protein